MEKTSGLIILFCALVLFVCGCREKGKNNDSSVSNSDSKITSSQSNSENVTIEDENTSGSLDFSNAITVIEEYDKEGQIISSSSVNADTSDNSGLPSGSQDSSEDKSEGSSDSSASDNDVSSDDYFDVRV